MSYHQLGGDRSKKILMYHLAQQQAAKNAAPPEEDLAPTITPEEELAILGATLPTPEPESSFLRRNAVPLFAGGGMLLLGTIGLILMVNV